jgi:hypothetical protein
LGNLKFIFRIYTKITKTTKNRYFYQWNSLAEHPFATLRNPHNDDHAWSDLTLNLLNRKICNASREGAYGVFRDALWPLLHHPIHIYYPWLTP